MGFGSLVKSAVGGAAGMMGISTAAGGLLSGGLGYMGTKDTNNTNAEIARDRNNFEAEEAVKARDFSRTESALNRSFQADQVIKQMQFERDMSNTAVQRRMLDMKTAGINPILAGKFEAGSPSGAAGSGSIGATAKANAHGYTALNKMQGAIDSLSTAISLRKMLADTSKVEADTALTVNKKKMSDLAANVLTTGNSAYDKAKDIAPIVGKKVGSSAFNLKRSVDSVIDRISKSVSSTYDKFDKAMSAESKRRRNRLLGNSNNPLKITIDNDRRDLGLE